MAEPRYIDANKIDFSLLTTAHLDDGCVYVNDARNLIDGQPTADVREVVYARWIDHDGHPLAVRRVLHRENVQNVKSIAECLHQVTHINSAHTAAQKWIRRIELWLIK